MRRFALLALVACGNPKTTNEPAPELQILGESTRTRLEDPFPAKSPWFDGTTVTLVGARGEVLGIQVLHHAGHVELAIPSTQVRGYDVEAFQVSHPSTELYGGSHGKGRYADGLVETARPTTTPAYFEITIDGEPGERTGELIVGERHVPIKLTVAAAQLPPLPRSVWAYEDARELGGTNHEPSDAERACIAMFREHGVLLSPDLPLDTWEERKELVDGFPFIPATLPDDPAEVPEQVRGWVTATEAGPQRAFAIPIDEPRSAEARAKVRALADAVRSVAPPDKFHYAVTDVPRAEYGDAVDLYIAWNAVHLTGDKHARWTYNGAPPFAGSMVLDALTPGTRTWGWIAWRWNVPVWYVWDATYWHDRHNKKTKRALDLADPISFDDGEDHGNLDGVLALPGCKRTLRLAALRRGLIDRQLLELASSCAPDETAKLAATMVPRALGDASGKAPSWPTDEAAWEVARRKLVALASCR